MDITVNMRNKNITLTAMDNYQKFPYALMFALIKPLIMTANKCVSLQHIKYGSH